MRINNLEFKKAGYLGGEPKHPAYHIGYYYPNSYYNNEDKFIKDGDFYRDPNDVYDFFRIHKDCFKYPENCFAIASFEYNDGFYELHFIGDRPLRYEFNKEDFWKLIEYGDKYLNNENSNS